MTSRRELWLLLTLAGIQFSHVLDFMILMPLGPQLTLIFGINDAQFGLLVSAYTLAAGASGLMASLYIDRFGRKRLLLALYVLFAGATLACGLAPGYGFLLGARIAAGLFGGVLAALVQTIVGDIIPFERRGRAMGVVMTSFSVSTVAGVPLGLFLAAQLGWHAPFFLIAGICVLFAVFAAATLPVLDRHLGGPERHFLGAIGQVLSDGNHYKAFGLSALTVFATFTIIPYITIYLQANAGLTAAQIPYLYLLGGAVTLFTARAIGRLTDARGKVSTYRLVALAATAPMVAMTVLEGAPLWLVLVVSTLFFFLTSGRMIPAMATVTSAAQPQVRGTFMTLNSSIQSASMGLASFVGGLLISRDAQGLVQGYWKCAVLGVICNLLAVWLAGRLRLHAGPPAKV